MRLKDAASSSFDCFKQPCPSCGGPMIIIETFEPGHAPRAPPPAAKAGSP